MKFFPFLLLIISFSLNACVHDENLIDSFPIENDIMILTDTTFEKAITKYENVFVAFYAPWCGHCQKLLPELEKVAEILSKENIIVAKVDATKEKNLSNKYKIVSYPILKFFKENTSIKYTGKKKQKELIEWARKMASPPVTYLKSLESIEKMKNENNVSVIYFGKEEKDIKIFKTLSVKNIDIPFAVVEDEKIAQLYKAVPKSVVVLKKFDEKRKDIINFDEKKLENFIKKNSEQKVFSFTNKNINLIFNKNKPAFVYFGRKGDLNWKKVTSTIEKLAYNVENDLIFIMTEINEGYGKNIAERIKLRSNEIPCIMILDVKINIDKYKYTGNYEYNDLVNFIDNWEKV
jgi:protein disulfide-isomerase A1